MAICKLLKSTTTCPSQRAWRVRRFVMMVGVSVFVAVTEVPHIDAQVPNVPTHGTPAASVAKLKFDASRPINHAGLANPSGANPLVTAIPARDTNTASLKLDLNANGAAPMTAIPTREFDQEFVRIGYWQSGGLALRDQEPSAATKQSDKTESGADPGFNGPVSKNPVADPAAIAARKSNVPPRDAATSTLLTEQTKTHVVVDSAKATTTSTAAPSASGLATNNAAAALDTPARRADKTLPTPNQSSTRLFLSDESLVGNQFGEKPYHLDDQAPPSPPSGSSITDPKFKFLGASYFKNQEPESLPTPSALPNAAVDPRYSRDSAVHNQSSLGHDWSGANADQNRSDFSCDIGVCSPLFYSTLWVGHSDLDTLHDDNWDPTQTNGRYHMSSGASAGLALGIFHGNNLRGEFEVAARSNNLDYFEVNRPVGIPTQQNYPLDGKLRTYSGMSNMYWDFGRSSQRRFRPYVGAGVGFAFLDADFENFGRSVMANTFDRDSSFAFQWMAGVNAAITRELEMFVEYRFFGTDELRLGTQFSRFGAQAGDPDQIFGDYDYRSQNILMGLRVKF